MKYPITVAQDIVDNYYGEAVADPYRWLEDDNSQRTRDWVAQQNGVTEGYLSQFAIRGALRKRMTELANYTKVEFIAKRGGYIYYTKNSGLLNQPVICRATTIGSDDEQQLFDVNTLSDGGTVALSGVALSRCGRFMSLQFASSGSDWNDIRVLDIASGEMLDDHIRWSKFCDVQWYGDGFLYSAYIGGENSDAIYQDKNEFHTVYYHKLGTAQSQDRVEMGSSEFADRFYEAVVCENSNHIFVTESQGQGNAIYVKDSEYRLLVPQMCDVNEIIGVRDNTLYILSDSAAPMGELRGVDIVTGEVHTVIPQGRYQMNQVLICGEYLLASFQVDAAHRVKIYNLRGEQCGEVELPDMGSVQLYATGDVDEAYILFNSYLLAPTLYRYDFRRGDLQLIFKSSIDFDFSNYVTTQRECFSADGTAIKYFVTHSRDIKLDGSNPTLLYGYGGFNISLNPNFSPYRLPFIEMGGVYVVATLRGGGEYGEQWHNAGTKERKQNVFDDFIAVAEDLINCGYTRSDKLAINGGSNGGLLVGAVVNQRPELFAAAVPQVGVMDMLRYHRFTIGWNWARDYGRSDEGVEAFNYLRAYSPLHNIKSDGAGYPAIMVTTGDHDDRVVPAHSFKYAATLQAADIGDAPHLIRIETDAGHGAGKPLEKVIAEQTDIYTFILSEINS